MFPEGYDGPQSPKKKAPTRVKREKGEADTYDGDWVKLMSSDNNQKLVTIPQLKEKLREFGLPLSGKKADLWERVKGPVLDGAGGGGNNKKQQQNKKIKSEPAMVKEEEEEF